MSRKTMLNLTAALICLGLLVGCSSTTIASSTNSIMSPPSSVADTVTSASEVDTGASEVDTGNEVDNIAPAFVLPLHGGGTVSLEELRGKPVLLNFFATWCGPCMAEMPDIQKIHDKYGDTIHVLCVDLGETSETVEKFLADENYSFPVALDIETKTSEPYSLSGIPQTYVLNSDGIITWHQVGTSDYETFAAQLDALL